VPEGVPAETEGVLARDTDGELSALLVGEQVFVGRLAGGVLADDRKSARRQWHRRLASPEAVSGRARRRQRTAWLRRVLRDRQRARPGSEATIRAQQHRRGPLVSHPAHRARYRVLLRLPRQVRAYEYHMGEVRITGIVQLPF